MSIKSVLLRAKTSIALTIVFSAISSFSILAIPFIERISDKNSGLMYVVAAAFWIGWLLVFVGTCFTKRTLHALREKLIVNGCVANSRKIGIASRPSNLAMMIICAIATIGVALCITDVKFNYIPQAVAFPILSLTVMLVVIHCVFDGKYYKTYKIIKENFKNGTNHKD